MKKEIIGFGTGNTESLFWRHIIDGGFDLEMDLKGNVVGPEILVMADQEKAADIASLVRDIVVYRKKGGIWKRQPMKRK